MTARWVKVLVDLVGPGQVRAGADVIKPAQCDNASGEQPSRYAVSEVRTPPPPAISTTPTLRLQGAQPAVKGQGSSHRMLVVRSDAPLLR